MSVVDFNKDLKLVVLSHKNFLHKLYGDLGVLEDLLNSFDVKTPFRMDLEADKVARILENSDTGKKGKKKRQRQIEDEVICKEVTFLRQMLDKSTKFLEQHFAGSPTTAEIRDNNKYVRLAVKDYLDKLSNCECPPSGENTTEMCLVKDDIVYPPRSAFINVDISRFSDINEEDPFDIILMDPPWVNKHIKRTNSGGYNMVENNVLENICLKENLSDNGLVFVWCTNSPTHRLTVRKMFSRWEVTEVAVWFWLKMTVHGELVCDFSHSKQPYEVCIVGQKGKCSFTIPDQLVICSVPSAIHSHKPPLNDLIEHVLNEENSPVQWSRLRKLELFGRNLSSGWKTVGNQPCLFNILKY